MSGTVSLSPTIASCALCGGPIAMGPVLPTAARVAQARFGSTLRDVRMHSRARQITPARALIVWALRSLGKGLSYGEIAKIIDRDHTTVIYLHRRAIALRLSDPDFARACREVEAVLYPEGEAA